MMLLLLFIVKHRELDTIAAVFLPMIAIMEIGIEVLICVRILTAFA